MYKSSFPVSKLLFLCEESYSAVKTWDECVSLLLITVIWVFKGKLRLREVKVDFTYCKIFSPLCVCESSCTVRAALKWNANKNICIISVSFQETFIPSVSRQSESSDKSVVFCLGSAYIYSILCVSWEIKCHVFLCEVYKKEWAATKVVHYQQR